MANQSPRISQGAEAERETMERLGSSDMKSRLAQLTDLEVWSSVVVSTRGVVGSAHIDVSLLIIGFFGYRNLMKCPLLSTAFVNAQMLFQVRAQHFFLQTRERFNGMSKKK